MKERKCTYRFFFGPETIGSIVYLAKRGLNFKKRLKAGYVLSCVGKSTAPCIITSRKGDSYSDKIAELAYREFETYDVQNQLKRGSDERQYCSAGMNLPITVLTGHRFGDYDQYHTSEDNLDFVTSEELEEMSKVLMDLVTYIEEDAAYLSTEIGEPMLSRYSLMPGMNDAQSSSKLQSRMTKNLVHFSMGELRLSEIALLTGNNFNELKKSADILEENGKLIRVKRNALRTKILQNFLIYKKLFIATIKAKFEVTKS